MTVLATSILISLIKIAAVLAIVFTLAPLLVWAERRQSAVIQDRVGPVRASIRIAGREIRLAGLLHPLADTLKMMWKEDFVPPRADKFLHSLAPIAALVPALMTLAVLPFGNLLHLEAWNQVVAEVEPGHWCVLGNAGQACVAELDFARGIPLQIASLDVGILFLFAIAGTGVVGAAIGGYASDNKYSLLGGLRAAGQMVSYEVVLGLTLVGCFMIYGSLRLEEMVRWQRDHAWGIVVQPVAALLYLTAAIAETKRIPFDVPEGESEIVGGYFTEYSGMKWWCSRPWPPASFLAAGACLSSMRAASISLAFGSGCRTSPSWRCSSGSSWPSCWC